MVNSPPVELETEILETQPTSESHPMDVCTQYAKYNKFCAKHHIAPQGFAHFVIDVFPYTLF